MTSSPFDADLREALTKKLAGAIFQCEDSDGIPNFVTKEGWDGLVGFSELVQRHRPSITAAEVRYVVHGEMWRAGKAFKKEGKQIFEGEKRIAQAYADRVIANVLPYFESLPHKCVFRFLIPGFAPKVQETVDLGGGCRLLLDPEADSLGAAVAAQMTGGPKPASTVLEVTVDGHLDDSWTPSASREAYSRLKQFYIVATVHGALKVPASWEDIPEHRGEAGEVVARNETVVGHDQTLKLPSDAATLLRRVENPPIPDPEPEGKKTATTILTGHAGQVQFWFEPLRELLKHDKESEEAKHIYAAIEWVFEATLQTNQTFEFILTCIALEALLGTKPKKGRAKESPAYGVTAQLADRCAFLLGRGQKERESLRAAFLELYDARSGLVHGTLVRLDPDATKHLEFAKTCVSRLIATELSHLHPRNALNRLGGF
jgi:hypothetical protein